MPQNGREENAGELTQAAAALLAAQEKPYLDERLSAAAALVEPGARVADVGCDHGKLSVYLAKSGRAARVIAIDVRPQPLEKARHLVEKTGCSQLVECRLADGLSCVSAGEVDTVIMAGISGITACEILSAAPWTKDAGVHIIAVPASKADVLRRWLAENGYALEAETAAVAAGRPYTALAARWNGEIFVPDECWCRLGLLAHAPDAAAQAYRQKVLRQLERQLAGETAGARYTQAQREELRRLRDEVESLCVR